MIKNIKRIIIKYHPNEYFCHIYFVYKIAMDLQKKYGGDKDIIAAAALLHDMGRHIKNKPHEIAGAKIAKRELKKINYPQKKLAK